MRLGFGLPAAGPWATPQNLARVARHAEALGYHSLWGSLDEIRADLPRYAEAGVTELFLDPNFQPGGPALEPVLALMESLAPVSPRGRR